MGSDFPSPPLDARRAHIRSVGSPASAAALAGVVLLAWGAPAYATPLSNTPQQVAGAQALFEAAASAFILFRVPKGIAATGTAPNDRPVFLHAMVHAMVTRATRMPRDGAEHPRDVAGFPLNPATRTDPPFIAAQAGPSTTLPSLVLPPAASTEPPLFVSLMRMGDAAMVRGDVTRARALYERAAAIHPASSAALIAAGKTYDPNMLSLLGMSSTGLADTTKARDRYESARALGDPAAASLLALLR